MITSSVEIPWHCSDGEGKASLEFPVKVSSSHRPKMPVMVKWFVLRAPAVLNLHELYMWFITFKNIRNVDV